MKGFTYRLAFDTTAGKREINQDSLMTARYLYKGEEVVFALVADGMGGNKGGEIASKIVAEAFERWFQDYIKYVLDKEPFEEALLDRWQELIMQCNRAINEQVDIEKGIIPGTTLTMLLLYQGKYYAANIGDSRIYRLVDRLYQITIDHSWVQLALERGATAEEIENDYRKHRITRCIGAGHWDNCFADFYSDKYKEGEYFLLCSDGLRHLISIEEFSHTLKAADLSLEDKVSRLISIALSRGESDNISCIIVEVEKERNA